MNKIATLSLAVLLLGSSAALAQRYDYGNRDAQRQAQNYDRQQQDQQNRDQNREQNAQEVRGSPHWARGDRLSEEYRGDRYVVGDWQANHLRRPPRGYHWIHVGDRYMLAAIASGVITDMILESQIRH